MLPIGLVFSAFLRPGPLAWGDAPSFYSEGLKELIAEPLAFTNRGINFGGINLLIWISPLNILYGILAYTLGLGNGLAIRLVFYFPSVILSILGTIFLCKYLGKSKVVSFFTSLVYVLNTYFLLVVDGGQVGFALAYGIFPLALLFLKKLADSPSLNKFLLALVALMFCSAADPRVALIAIATVIIWQTIENLYKKRLSLFKNFLPLLLVIISWIGLSSYWIVPLIKNQALNQTLSGVTLPTNRLVDAFLLFSPHWPANVFGKISSPPLYFILVPVIIFIPFAFLLFSKKNKILDFLPSFLCYVIFCLLTVAAAVFAKLPFGFAFRDTSKFFIPVILFAGLLIGNTVELINKKIFTALVYVYLLVLIWPALLGKMNFVLSGRTHGTDLQKVYENLRNDNSFFRTLWIPERHPLTYDVINKPALDGNSLVRSAPFAWNNAGEDPFNFLNYNFIEWFRVLGIKYIFLSDDQRSLNKTEKEQGNWQEINSIVAETKGLKKLNWNIAIPVFEVPKTLPRFFAVEKVYGVVGKPINDPNIPSLNYEDGLFDPALMKEISPKGYSIVFNGGNKVDLQMSLLQKYFQAPRENTMSQWAVYTHESYLKYKYELLIRGVKFEDLDYGRGLAFSTKPGEKLEFSFEVGTPGDYVFAHRSMVPDNKETSLSWQFENVNVSKGVFKKELVNQNSLQVLNVVALIPKKEFESSRVLADDLIKSYFMDISKIAKSPIKYRPLEITNWGSLKYKFVNPGESYWIIFTDSYNPLWKLRTGQFYFSAYPAYSMVNAFYIDPKWNDLEIQFKGQDNLRWGVYLTIVSGLIVSIIYIWKKSK